jgi:hypothetical protein
VLLFLIFQLISKADDSKKVDNDQCFDCVAGCNVCKTRSTCAECKQDPLCTDRKFRVIVPGEDKCVDCAYDPDTWVGYFYDDYTCRKCLGPQDKTCDVCDDATNCRKCLEPMFFLMVGNTPRNCQTCKWDNNYYHQQRGHFGVVVAFPKTTIDQSNYCYRSCATYCAVDSVYPGCESNITPAINSGTNSGPMCFDCDGGTLIDECWLCKDQYTCYKCNPDSEYRYVILLPDLPTKTFNVHLDKCVKCNLLGQKANPETGYCHSPCVEFCKTCATYNSCQLCLEGYYLKDDKTCKQCSEDCADCSPNPLRDNTVCNTCNSTHYKMIGKENDCLNCNRPWQVVIGKISLQR